MNTGELKNILVEKYDYKKSQVDGVVEKIGRFPPDIAAAFENWMSTGEIDGLAVEGFTVRDVLAKRKMQTAAAYLFLDWLRREPDEAKAFLNEKPFINSIAGNL